MSVLRFMTSAAFALAVAAGFAAYQQGQAAEEKQGGRAPAIETADSQSAVVKPDTLVNESIDGSALNDASQAKAATILAAYDEAAKTNRAQAIVDAISEFELLIAVDPVHLPTRSWLGYLYIQNEDYRKAIGVLADAIGRSKQEYVNTLNLRNYAMAHYGLEEWPGAIAFFTQLHTADPTEAIYPRLAGSASLLSGNAEAAEPLLISAMNLEADKTSESYLSAQKDLGIAQATLGRAGDALKTFEAVAEAEGFEPEESGDFHAWMGFAYLQAKQFDKAIVSLKKAKGTSADQVTVLNNLGNALSASKRYAEAVEVYTELSKLDKTLVTPWYNIGSLYIRQEKYADAVPALRKGLLVAAEQKVPEASTRYIHNNLGYSLERIANHVEAAAEYAKASDLDPKSRTFARNAGMAWFRVNSPERSRVYLLRFESLGEKDPEVTKILAELNVRTGRNEEALAQMEELVKVEPGRADLWFNIGVLKQRLGDAKGSEEAYLKTLELAPADLDASNNLGLLLYGQKRYIEALSHFEKISGADPDSIQAKINLAAVFVKLNRITDAVDLWRVIIHKDPRQTGVRLSLADAYWMQGLAEDARHHYAVVLKDFPKSARALNGMGLWHLSKTELKQAEDHFRRAIAAEEKYMPPYNNLSIALEKQNRVGEAILILEKAIKLDPDFEDAKKSLKRLKSATI